MNTPFPVAAKGVPGYDPEQVTEFLERARRVFEDQESGLSAADIRGTVFQTIVWGYLTQIPPGTVQSYTEVATAIGKPRAVRAVASACANNKIAIAIPCHRVIRGDGSLAGYKWGLERKKALLDLERGTLSKS